MSMMELIRGRFKQKLYACEVHGSMYIIGSGRVQRTSTSFVVRISSASDGTFTSKTYLSPTDWGAS